MTRTRRSAIVQLSTLALWLGAAAFFSLVGAPALFASLPSRTLAGAVVGRMLPPLFFSGMLAGTVLAGLQLATGEEWMKSGRVALGTTMVAACATAQLAIAPRIDALRRAIAGAVDAVPAADPQRTAFGRLHATSVALLGIAMLSSTIAMVVCGRAANAAASPLGTTHESLESID